MAWNLGFLGQYAAALEHGRRALALIRSVGNRLHEMWTLNTLGTLCGRQRENAAAAEYFDDAQRIAEAIGATAPYVTICNNAGLNYLGMGEPAKALKAAMTVTLMMGMAAIISVKLKREANAMKIVNAAPDFIAIMKDMYASPIVEIKKYG